MNGVAMSGGASAGDSPVVFVSYSREDAEWRRKFVEMLKPLVRERRLEVWSDDRNVIGYEWRPQLAQAIARSRAGRTKGTRGEVEEQSAGERRPGRTLKCAATVILKING
jgi:hypothetical protein